MVVLVALLGAGIASAADVPEHTRTRDVVYGRKHGLALTMDVFTPKKSNGLAAIAVVSAKWESDVSLIWPTFYYELLRRGYTVFAVLHGAQPKFTLPEIIDDMHRAVRFIRHNAKTYAIDPERIGITGGSSGGHLALMLGNAGGPGDPEAKDPVDRLSSKVQAVGCFFPPTDFLNYGAKGKEVIGRDMPAPLTAATDYREFDKQKGVFVMITDAKKLRDITRAVSPITHVSESSAPTLFIHGDKDDLVPLQQSETMLAKLQASGVTAKLTIHKGGGHGWLTLGDDMTHMADWLDTHLAKKQVTPKP